MCGKIIKYDFYQTLPIYFNFKILSFNSSTFLFKTLIKTLQDYKEALLACDKAVEIDSSNAKGFYRRAQAQIGLQQFDLAIQDLKKAQVMELGNKSIADEIIKVEAEIKKNKNSEKAKYSKMFKS